MGKRENFAIVIEHPRKVEVGSIIHIDDRQLKIKKIATIESIDKNAFLVCGIGKRI